MRKKKNAVEKEKPAKKRPPKAIFEGIQLKEKKNRRRAKTR